MTSPSSVFTGLASLVFSVVIVQPVIGFTLTNAIGYFVGMVTSSAIVFASSFSFGTEKLMISKPPFGNDDGSDLTCAAATPTEISMVTAMTAATPGFGFAAWRC